jgi:hypothetical protein
VIRSAVLSPCGKYRYCLMREFEAQESLVVSETSALFVLNNPSIADASIDDPTSRRGTGFTASWGYRRYHFANSNPWRSTDPKLAGIPPEDILLENDAWLRRLASEAAVIIAAWGGKANKPLAARALAVLTSVADVHALELSKDGTSPKHILYLKGSLQPALWRGQAAAPVLIAA